MKLSDVARYWAAKELTTITRDERGLAFRAPFACPAFTVKAAALGGGTRRFETATSLPLKQVGRLLDLAAGTWMRDGGDDIVCLDLPKGTSRVS
jgi:hypothetical protein